MSAFTDFNFPSANGKINIHVRSCVPHGEIKATMQIAHGIAEHSRRYDEFASFLAENGIAVYTNDHMGHGESISDNWTLAYFGEDNGWENAVEDMKNLHKIIVSEHPNVPAIIFGHSMGSFLARTYIIKYPNDFNGVILSGTGQQSKALVNAGKLMSKLQILKHGANHRSEMLNDLAFGTYNNSFKPARTSHDWLSRDTAQVDKYIADSLCGFIPSTGLFYQMMRGIDYISAPSNLKKMNKEVPVYFMSGDADPVGESGKGVYRAYRSFLKAGIKDLSIRLYTNGRHEMLNETCKTEVYNDILTCIEDWIK